MTQAKTTHKEMEKMLDDEVEKLRKMFNDGYTLSNEEYPAYLTVAMIRVLKGLKL